MNTPQTIETGKGMLQDNYGPAYEALKKRLLNNKAKKIGLDEQDADDQQKEED